MRILHVPMLQVGAGVIDVRDFRKRHHVFGALI